MRFKCLILLLILAVTGDAASTRFNRGRYYRKHTYGKGALARSAGSAAFGTLRNSPRRWGRSPLGLVKRFGSSVATRAVKNSIEYGVGTVRHEDPRYYRSAQGGVGRRIKHALVSTVVVPRTNRPGKTVGAGRIAGNLGAGTVSRLWVPHSGGVVASGVSTGGIMLGADAGMNVFKEFYPDLKRKIRGRPSGVRRVALRSRTRPRSRALRPSR